MTRTIPARRLAWAAGAMLICGICGYSPSALSVFRDTLQAYYHLDLSEFGLLLSIGPLPGAVGGLLGGLLVNRYGPLSVLRAALVIAAAGLVLTAVAFTFAAMLTAVIVVSFALALVGVAVPAYLVRLFPDHQRRALSLQLVTVSLVGMTFPLAAEYLLRLHTHGGVPFPNVLHIPMAALAAVLLVCALFFRGRSGLAAICHREREAMERGSKFSLRGISVGGTVLIAVLSLHCTCDNLIGTWLPRVLDSASYSVKSILPGVVLAAGGFAYVVSRVILSLLPEHTGRRVLMVAPGLLGGSVLVCGLLTGNQLLTSVSYIAAMFLWSAEFPVFLATASRVHPRQFGTIYAIMSLCQGLAFFMGGLAMGKAGQMLGEQRLWMILLPPAAGFVLVGLGGALWLTLNRREQAVEK